MTLRFASLASLLVLATPLACVLTTDLDDDDTDTGDATDTDDDTGEPPEIAVEDAAAAMAAARCAAYVECGCDAFGDVTWATQAQCEAAILPDLQEQVALGQGMGLTYEPSCAAAYVAYYASSGCAPASDTVIEEVAAGLACTLFSGDGALGTPCTDPTWHLPSVEPCMPGLACISGQCDDPHKAEGDACNGAGMVLQDCEPPLYCDGTTTPPTCRPRLAIGESCDNVGQCVPSGWCNADDICEAGLEPGAQCLDVRECEFGYCGPESVCIQPPRVCNPVVFAEEDACESATAAADDFIDANSACEVADDCIAIDGFCYGASTCGSIAVSAEHDADTWMEIETALEGACECGADPCGATPACVDNRCVMELG
jgi:hypothetical protein